MAYPALPAHDRLRKLARQLLLGFIDIHLNSSGPLRFRKPENFRRTQEANDRFASDYAYLEQTYRTLGVRERMRARVDLDHLMNHYGLSDIAPYVPLNAITRRFGRRLFPFEL